VTAKCSGAAFHVACLFGDDHNIEPAGPADRAHDQVFDGLSG
jgi:hypothetical protein